MQNLHSSQESLLFLWSAGSLEQLLEIWKGKLKNWAKQGAISRAATDALALKGEPQRLQTLVSQWAAGDFSGLPPVVILPSSSMPEAAGAYASSTRTIYLNQDWLQGNSTEQALGVLTEELGHHLDDLLNAADTPGDEAALFMTLLVGGVAISEAERSELQAEDDNGSVLLDGRKLYVEQAAKLVSRSISVSGPGRTSGEFRNEKSFAALKSDGSVVTWGDPSSGGDSSAVASQLRSGVSQIFSSGFAFAALKSDGSVVTWGDPNSGGDSSAVASQLRSGISQIFSSGFAFAALKSDGSVVTWGSPGAGGDSSAVASQLRSGVEKIFSSAVSFAALKSDGSVVTWGYPRDGGDSSAVASQLRSGVRLLSSTRGAFSALKDDGSVVTWGYPPEGGDSSAVVDQLQSGIRLIFSTGSIYRAADHKADSDAFAALKEDGSVVTWGSPDNGGDSNAVASEIRINVRQIFSTYGAFAALKNDGSVVTWGNSSLGGNSSGVASQLREGVRQIFSTYGAFAALKDDGSVVTWGNSNYGADSSAVASRLRSGIVRVFSNNRNFAALKDDGSIIQWGNSLIPNSQSGVLNFQLNSGVRDIFGSGDAFAALKSDGSVVTWGFPWYGGNSSAVASQLRSGVVAFANPFTDERLVSFTPQNDIIPSSTYSIVKLNTTDLKSDAAEGSRHYFRINRSGIVTIGGSVRFSTSNGTAISGTDYLSYSKLIVFKPGDTKKDVYVESLEDLLNENTENFKATISKINPKDKIGTASTFGSIFNLAPPSTYTIQQLKSDGTEGSRHTFLIKRKGGLSSPGQVRFSTSSGTATSGVDFKPYTAIRNFAINQDKDTVYVDSIKDSINEPTERFNVSIQTVRAQDKLGASSTSGQIFNIFTPTTYSIETLNTADRKSNALEGSRHYFRIKRTGNVAGAGSVRLNTSSGTAIIGTDFLPYPKVIEFKPGEREKDVYVESLIDSLNEGAENFRVSISKIASQDILASSSVDGQIRNRIIDYVGVDKDNQPFKMNYVDSDPSWSVRFRLKNSRITPGLPAYVYVHGWKDTPDSMNSGLMLATLAKKNANVILVDWSGMAAKEYELGRQPVPGKAQPIAAASVTKQVGESLADFLVKSGVSLPDTTLIGHSLGSFVAASAAKEVSIRSNQRVKELVVLDNAFGPFLYDIDGRTFSDIDEPLEFTTDLALSTTSYTASDLIQFPAGTAGDNDRAATAQNAYIVQYARSSDLPDGLFNQALAFHNGVIGVYADLFAKNALHPIISNRFDAFGKPAAYGKFDGAIVAPMPWTYVNGKAVIKAPKAVGWANSFQDPIIYGTKSNDILFFDKFVGEHNGCSLIGLEGDDWLVADQTDPARDLFHVDPLGVDTYTGGPGKDEFWLGYQRYGKKVESYKNPVLFQSKSDVSSYALITDFKPTEDFIRLPLAKNAYSFTPSTNLSGNLNSLHGIGIGIEHKGDLVAYVTGLNSSQVTGLLDKRITFGAYAPLDTALFA